MWTDQKVLETIIESMAEQIRTLKQDVEIMTSANASLDREVAALKAENLNLHNSMDDLCNILIEQGSKMEVKA